MHRVWQGFAISLVALAGLSARTTLAAANYSLSAISLLNTRQTTFPNGLPSKMQGDFAELNRSKSSNLYAERVQFRQGTTSTVLRGVIRDYDTKDYTLGVRKRQTMTVQLQSNNRFLFFVVRDPNGENVYDGSVAGNSWSGRLLADGNYTIRILLVRAEARRGGEARYTMQVAVQ